MGVFQTFAGNDSELASALKEFNTFRNKQNRTMSDEAKRRFCQKLEKFPREQWIPIIQQSIDHEWLDIYPLKEINAKSVSGDPKKWAKSPAFLQAIQELLSDGIHS